MALFKKTLFDTSNLINATDNTKGGQHGISLYVTPFGNKKSNNRHSLKIDGILKNSIDWSVNANWENINPSSILSSIAGSNPLLEALDTGVDLLFAAGGTSYTNTGLFTRKYYKQSGYLSIKPSFRIFDYDNRGTPIQMGLILSSLCLATIDPKASMELITPENSPAIQAIGGKVIDTTVGTVTNTAAVIVDTIEGNKTTGASTKTTIGDFAKNTGEVMKKSLNAAVVGLEGARVSVSNGPDTVIIEIGNWLRLTDMVVDSVNITYSEQMTDMGPLYADIDIALSSLETMAFNEDGTISQMQLTTNLNNSNRVSFTDNINTKFQG